MSIVIDLLEIIGLAKITETRQPYSFQTPYIFPIDILYFLIYNLHNVILFIARGTKAQSAD
jgi:hypothetical protein